MWGVLQMSFMKLPKIILFDLDGVILDTESIYLKLMMEYNKKVNLPITKEFYINNFLGRTKKGRYAKYRTINKKIKKRIQEYKNNKIRLISLISSINNLKINNKK